MTMITETILLLTPYEDCSKYKLAKYFKYKLVISIPIDICFYQPLQNIFSKVILYDYWKKSVEIGIKGTNNEIIELIRKEHPKYVLWVAIGEYYEVKLSTFDAIREEGSVIVGWLFDVDIRFDYYSKWLISYIDYFIVDDKESLPKFNALGAWATQAICTGQSMELDWSKQKEKFEISFVGSLRGNRNQYISEIQSRNLPIHLFGLNWGKFVSYQEMHNIFVTSKINLNFSMDFNNGKQVIKARIFEVCLTGGFLLTEHFPGIEKYFEIDKEIVCFKNKQEMIDKITYYLNHNEERRAIAKAGWERAKSEYSAFHIMSRVFQEIDDDISNGQKRKLTRVSMPNDIRKKVSDFYLNYGEAFLTENDNGLWKDALALSIRYYPFNKFSWYLYIGGFLPYPIRIFKKRLNQWFRAFY